MQRYLFFVLLTTILLGSCQDSAQTNTRSPYEQGKSYLADADRLVGANDKMEAKKYYKQAVKSFEDAVRQDPNQKGLSQQLGISQYRIRDFDNAIQWLTKATHADPKDAVSQQYLGYSLINKSKIPEAEAAFKKAFFLNPSGVVKKEIIVELSDIGELSLGLGNNFANQGNPAQGIEFKKLGMRILAMALEYSEYDLNLAKKIKTYAVDMKDQILMDWISNVIDSEEKKTNVIEIKQ